MHNGTEIKYKDTEIDEDLGSCFFTIEECSKIQEKNEQRSCIDILKEDCGIKTSNDIKDLMLSIAKKSLGGLDAIEKITYSINDKGQLEFEVFERMEWNEITIRSSNTFKIEGVLQIGEDKKIKHIIVKHTFMTTNNDATRVVAINFGREDTYDEIINEIFREAKSEGAETDDKEIISKLKRDNELSITINFECQSAVAID